MHTEGITELDGIRKWHRGKGKHRESHWAGRHGEEHVRNQTDKGEGTQGSEERIQKGTQLAA